MKADNCLSRACQIPVAFLPSEPLGPITAPGGSESVSSSRGGGEGAIRPRAHDGPCCCSMVPSGGPLPCAGTMSPGIGTRLLVFTDCVTKWHHLLLVLFRWFSVRCRPCCPASEWKSLSLDRSYTCLSTSHSALARLLFLEQAKRLSQSFGTCSSSCLGYSSPRCPHSLLLHLSQLAPQMSQYKAGAPPPSPSIHTRM